MISCGSFPIASPGDARFALRAKRRFTYWYFPLESFAKTVAGISSPRVSMHLKGSWFEERLCASSLMESLC